MDSYVLGQLSVARFFKLSREELADEGYVIVDMFNANVSAGDHAAVRLKELIKQILRVKNKRCFRLLGQHLS